MRVGILVALPYWNTAQPLTTDGIRTVHSGATSLPERVARLRCRNQAYVTGLSLTCECLLRYDTMLKSRRGLTTSCQLLNMHSNE